MKQMGAIFPVIYKLSQTSQQLLAENLDIHFITAAEAKTLAPGDTSKFMYFLLSGSARVYQISNEGREYTLYRLYPGEVCVLSADSILKERSFPAFLNLEEDAQVVAVPQTIFHTLFNEDSAWKEFILSEMTDKIFLLMELAENKIFKNNEQQLVNYLVKQAQNQTILMTHSEIAADLGTAREVVSRTLKKFEKRGWVKLSRNRIVIIDLLKLKEQLM
ncbi:helix-turn-helix domain-containing protein [Erwinia sp. CPCC 100877]|nr:helix-turn-helix domain-containing protein [Erwinia sp. CPCC 100877]